MTTEGAWSRDGRRGAVVVQGEARGESERCLRQRQDGRRGKRQRRQSRRRAERQRLISHGRQERVGSVTRQRRVVSNSGGGGDGQATHRQLRGRRTLEKSEGVAECLSTSPRHACPPPAASPVASARRDSACGWLPPASKLCARRLTGCSLPKAGPRACPSIIVVNSFLLFLLFPVRPPPPLLSHCLGQDHVILGCGV